MHKIELVARGSNDIDVMLFDELNRYMPAFSMPHLTPVQAYIYVRGLVGIFHAGMHANSISVWQYIELMWRAEGSQN